MLDKVLQLQSAIREIMTGESFADVAVRGVCNDLENACTEFAQAVLDGLKQITNTTPENDAEENRLMKADDVIQAFINENQVQIALSGGRACTTCYHCIRYDCSIECVLGSQSRHRNHCDVCEHWESRVEGGYRKPAVKS